MKFISLFLCLCFAILTHSQAMAKNQNFDQQYAQWQKTQPATSVNQSRQSTTTKINLNTANVQELQQLSGVGEAKAKAIVAYREKQGKFKSIEELKNVKGIGDALFKKNKAKITI